VWRWLASFSASRRAVCSCWAWGVRWGGTATVPEVRYSSACCRKAANCARSRSANGCNRAAAASSSAGTEDPASVAATAACRLRRDSCKVRTRISDLLLHFHQEFGEYLSDTAIADGQPRHVLFPGGLGEPETVRHAGLEQVDGASPRFPAHGGQLLPRFGQL